MMGNMPFFNVAFGSILLIALGVGYIVLYLAKKAEKALKVLGYVIGVFIILASTTLILGKLVWRMKACSNMSSMEDMMDRQKQMHHHMQPPLAQPQK